LVPPAIVSGALQSTSETNAYQSRPTRRRCKRWIKPVFRRVMLARWSQRVIIFNIYRSLLDMLKSARPTLLAVSLCFALPALAAPANKAAAAAQAPPTTPLVIAVDMSEAPRKLWHADITVPVQPGTVTLTTPKWIPGNHRPSGPIENLTGIVFTANGQPLVWRRDDVDLYAFHITVPAGVTSINAHVDAIVTSRVTDKMAVLEWEKLLLYPADTPVHDIPITPSIKVPPGWGVGTALTPTAPATSAADGSTTQFATVSVEMLEDSPVLTGLYFKEIPLATDVTPKHFLDITGDAPEDIELSPTIIAGMNRLVHETGAAYASRHYNSYHFLLTLSDVAGGQGLEHHQSSDNGLDEKAFDESHSLLSGDLMTHEFTHSWCGKYRRPVGLATPNYSDPMKGELLWVYEGLTQYLGEVMAARTGFFTLEQFRGQLAYTAASLDQKPGRLWRSTEDTAISSSILRGGDPAWSNWRRSQDYYQEGELLWLDADTLIREKTNNQKSLTDFLAIFLGKGGDTGPIVVPYDFAELVADLNQTMPYDWDTFLRDRVNKITPRADVAGIERGGYRLVYKDKPNPFEKAIISRLHGIDAWFSLGIRTKSDGTLTDVRVFSIADKAKLFPGEKIIAVNGRVFDSDLFKNAIRDAKGTTAPIHLIVQSDTYLYEIDINYHDGEKYPVLERVDGTPDRLDDILKPMTAAEAAPPADK
jgi:predicted metalloprotease with PDZ domain